MAEKIKTKISFWVVFVALFAFAEVQASPINEEVAADDLSVVEVDEHEADMNDPLEYLNRGIYGVNRFVDGLVLRPLAYGYRDLLFDPIKARVSNVIDNLATPVTLANDILQLKPDRAFESMARFFINTTIGLLGLFDVAADCFDIQPHKEDFGQTLGYWGLGDGPYLMLPILGPSNLRDAVGRVADYIIDPYNAYMRVHNHEGAILARSSVDAVVSRERVLDLTESIDKTEDPYKQYRILYMQNRQYAIADGKIARESPVPSEMEAQTDSEPK